MSLQGAARETIGDAGFIGNDSRRPRRIQIEAQLAYRAPAAHRLQSHGWLARIFDLAGHLAGFDEEQIIGLGALLHQIFARREFLPLQVVNNSAHLLHGQDAHEVIGQIFLLDFQPGASHDLIFAPLDTVIEIGKEAQSIGLFH